MSFWLHSFPLHMLAGDGGWDWAANASFSYGLPERPPEPRPVPAAAHVMAALVFSGCHGLAGFTVEGSAAAGGLPQCPDPADCARRGGLDLGEVALSPADPLAGREHFAAGALIDSVGFRQPSARGALTGFCALTTVAGPLLVFDDMNHGVFVIREDDKPDALAAHWPW